MKGTYLPYRLWKKHIYLNTFSFSTRIALLWQEETKPKEHYILLKRNIYITFATEMIREEPIRKPFQIKTSLILLRPVVPDCLLSILQGWCPWESCPIQELIWSPDVLHPIPVCTSKCSNIEFKTDWVRNIFFESRPSSQRNSNKQWYKPNKVKKDPHMVLPRDVIWWVKVAHY